MIRSFREKGMVIIPELLNGEQVNRLRAAMVSILDGTSPGVPDKKPKRLKAGVLESFMGENERQVGGKTVQIINTWKAHPAFREVILDEKLGKIVAELGGWRGCRVGNDQVWAKPPGSGALNYHRDSSYFDFSPSDVITAWIALDDMDSPKIGSLEYAVGSHKWADDDFDSGGVNGKPKKFFESDNLLRRAADNAGVDEIDIVRVSVKAGGCSIHDGRTFHGSGANETRRPRRGLGIHFIPADAKFRPESRKTFASRFKVKGSLDLPNEHFPLTYVCE